MTIMQVGTHLTAQTLGVTLPAAAAAPRPAVTSQTRLLCWAEQKLKRVRWQRFRRRLTATCDDCCVADHNLYSLLQPFVSQQFDSAFCFTAVCFSLSFHSSLLQPFVSQQFASAFCFTVVCFSLLFHSSLLQPFVSQQFASAFCFTAVCFSLLFNGSLLQPFVSQQFASAFCFTVVCFSLLFNGSLLQPLRETWGVPFPLISVESDLGRRVLKKASSSKGISSVSLL